MSLSSVVAAGQASLLKCEATLNALQAAFTQARSELAEVRSALDSISTTRGPEINSPATLSSSQLGNLDDLRSPWDLAEETSTTAVKEITNGKSFWSLPCLWVNHGDI